MPRNSVKNRICLKKKEAADKSRISNSHIRGSVSTEYATAATATSVYIYMYCKTDDLFGVCTCRIDVFSWKISPGTLHEGERGEIGRVG